MAEKKRRGRRPVLDKAKIKKAAKILCLGLPEKDAAAAVGVCPQTWCTWKAKGKNATTGIYRDFLEEAEAAKIAAKPHLLGIVHRAAKRDWRAAAWALERLFPEQFGRRCTMVGNCRSEEATLPSNIPASVKVTFDGGIQTALATDRHKLCRASESQIEGKADAANEV